MNTWLSLFALEGFVLILIGVAIACGINNAINYARWRNVYLLNLDDTLRSLVSQQRRIWIALSEKPNEANEKYGI